MPHVCKKICWFLWLAVLVSGWSLGLGVGWGFRAVVLMEGLGSSVVGSWLQVAEWVWCLLVGRWEV